MYAFNYLGYCPYEGVIRDERLKWENYYKIIESFIKKNNLYIGGNIACDLLQGNQTQNIYDFEYEIYGFDIYNHGMKLADLIAPISKDVVLKTVVLHKKLQLWSNSRVFCNLYNIDEHADQIIMPLKKDGFYEKELLVIPPEIMLITLYHTLYDPAQYDDWAETIENEKTLFKILKDRKEKLVGEGETEVEGGSNELKLDSYNSRKEFLDFMLHLIRKTDIILIGDHAIEMISDKKSDSLILSVIGDHDTASTLIKLIRTKYKDAHITETSKYINVIKDYRLKRTILRASKDEKEIIYIYNCTDYETIPTFVQDGYRIGSGFVILRFLIIDLWIIRWIRSMNAIDEGYANKRQEVILKGYINFRYFLQDKDELKFILKKEDYIGTYINEAIAEKEKKVKLHITDYLPKS